MTILPPPDGAAPRPLPPVSAAGQAYWDATRELRLVIQWCRACERPIHYPRDACPRCLGDDLVHRDASGAGTVHALSVMPKPSGAAMAGREPYVVALVDLDEGVRMMTGIVGAGALDVRIGDRVRVVWEPLADGRHLPLFAPDPSEH